MFDTENIKIKILIPFGYASESICTLKEAEYRLFSNEDMLVVAEGELVNSYDELIQVIKKENNLNKEIIEVRLSYLISGG